MYLIDTNILIYYINGELSAIDFINNSEPLVISIISVIEVLSHNYTDDERVMIITFLKNNFSWLYVNNEIALLSAHHRTLKKTKTPDAIIGATAIYYHCTLVTHNTKDFIHLPIALFDPM